MLPILGLSMIFIMIGIRRSRQPKVQARRQRLGVWWPIVQSLLTVGAGVVFTLVVENPPVVIVLPGLGLIWYQYRKTDSV